MVGRRQQLIDRYQLSQDGGRKATVCFGPETFRIIGSDDGVLSVLRVDE